MSKARERSRRLRQSLEVKFQHPHNQLVQPLKAGSIDLPCLYHYMRRIIIACLTLCHFTMADAQYIPAFRPDTKVTKDPGEDYWSKGNSFRHLEVSLTAGTSGIGLDVAVPICRFLQIRAGYDYMPRFKKSLNMHLAGGGQAARQYNEAGNRIRTPFDKIEQYMYEQTGMELDDHIVLTGKMTMNNWKLLVDVYPLKYNKHWHLTAGVYWGPAEFAQSTLSSESSKTIALMESYNQSYEAAGDGDAIKGYGRLTLYPGDYAHDITQGLTLHHQGDPYLADLAADGTVSTSVRSNAVKPYVGIGYTGRLVSSRDDWKVSAELGVMIWGGTPSQRLHDGMDLSRDVKNIPGALGDYVGVIKALKVYPVLSVRIAKTIF